jgi:hypothetical protein
MAQKGDARRKERTPVAPSEILLFKLTVLLAPIGAKAWHETHKKDKRAILLIMVMYYIRMFSSCLKRE